jgi:radical SAM protein with 4Fe4S-binding SPASM domain
VPISDERIDELLQSGLEYLCLSIDGASQDVYARYRRRGNLELVLANVRRLVKRRAELGLRRPVLEWQFIPMRHNEHEVEAARALARDIGVDVFRCIPVGLPFDSVDSEALAEKWFPVQAGQGPEMSSNDQADSACYFLYRYLVINPDGGVSPCCVVSGAKNDFGSLEQERLGDLWNNAMFRSGRALYRRGGAPTEPTVCERCDLFAKRSSRPGAPHPVAATIPVKVAASADATATAQQHD